MGWDHDTMKSRGCHVDVLETPGRGPLKAGLTLAKQIEREQLLEIG